MSKNNKLWQKTWHSIPLWLISIVLICIISSAVTAISLTSTGIVFHQNPIVPPQPSPTPTPTPEPKFVVYHADGTTLITNGSDQTSIWQWDETTHTLNATIVVSNHGTAEGTPRVWDDLMGWTFQVQNNGNIPVGDSRTINLSMRILNKLGIPPAGPVGDFNVVVDYDPNP